VSSIFESFKNFSRKVAAAGRPQEEELITIEADEALPWKGVVWHHSFSADTVVRNWDAIKKYHTSYRIDFTVVTEADYHIRLRNKHGKYYQKPWRAVGYHGGVELYNGDPVYNEGRPLNMIGAHAGVKGASNRFNTEYVGLCAIGNFDLTAPPAAIWQYALKVTRVFMAKFNFPASHVIGHREVYAKLGVPVQKTCPGKYWDMHLFRQELKKEA